MTTSASFAKAAIEAHVPEADRPADAMARFLERLTYVTAEAAQETGWHDLEKALQDSERIRVFYLAVGPDLFGPICDRLGAHNLVTPTHPRGDRKAAGQVRRFGPRPERVDRQGVHRTADLPHRPLSRQRDGAEPDGAALRQCAVRARVEFRPHRPCADHRGRDPGRRRPRRLLRYGRSAPRHGAEPHAAASLPRRHGAADFDRRRCAARRETESAEGAEADHRRCRGQSLRARPISRRCRRGRRRQGLSRGTGRYHVEDRDLRGAQGRDRQLALERRALLPAHRQAPAVARVGNRRHLQAHSAFGVRALGRTDRRPTGWSSACSPTKASSCG